MKNSIKTTDNDFQLISVVIPSLNGNYGKLLFLTGEEYDKLKKTSKSNSGKCESIYALYAESNMYHDILTSGTGGLNRAQFDELLKNGYNSKIQMGRNGVELKQVV
ncbi:hypothetical protein [Flavobacterium sp. DSR2-3-3]|uniref:hypothetical protein n=1 Tax=Flavobacterium sp. DSR2-3-3 TaxID=2804632 RepID=UPI003CF522FC